MDDRIHPEWSGFRRTGRRQLILQPLIEQVMEETMVR